MKKIVSNPKKSIIENSKLHKILGGTKYLTIECNRPTETLKQSDHLYRCDGTDIGLSFQCDNGATLSDKSIKNFTPESASYTINITEL